MSKIARNTPLEAAYCAADEAWLSAEPGASVDGTYATAYDCAYDATRNAGATEDAARQYAAEAARGAVDAL